MNLKIRQAMAQGDTAPPMTFAESLALPDGEKQVWLSRGAMRRGNRDIDPLGLTAAIEGERERIRNLILSNPKQAASELGIEHLAFYPTIPAEPRFRLIELAEFFRTNRRNEHGLALSKKWLASVSREWGPTKIVQTSDKRKRRRRATNTTFCDIVTVPFVRDVKQEHIIAYRDASVREFEQRNLSPSWLNTRYKAIKSVLSFALEESPENEKTDIRRVLELCEDKLKERVIDVNPSPIRPEHFRTLLEVASTREKAIMLLGANCLMHGGEAATTLKEDIHWEDGTLRARRTKNRNPRVAVLWERSLSALKAYMAESPHQHKALFTTKHGPMSGEYFRKKIVELRELAGLPEYVTFEGVRDAGYAAAEEVDSQRAPWIAGHKTGQKDSYILRMPDKPRIKKCCKAVEHYFFAK